MALKVVKLGGTISPPAAHGPRRAVELDDFELIVAGGRFTAVPRDPTRFSEAEAVQAFEQQVAPLLAILGVEFGISAGARITEVSSVDPIRARHGARTLGTLGAEDPFLFDRN